MLSFVIFFLYSDQIKCNSHGKWAWSNLIILSYKVTHTSCNSDYALILITHQSNIRKRCELALTSAVR